MSFPVLPDELAGWRWSDNPKNGHVFLMHPNVPPKFTTRHYPDPDRAIAEARRWVLSQPKPKEVHVTTNTLTFEQAVMHLRGLGYTVRQHGARYLVALGDAPPTPMRPVELIDLATGLQGAEAAEAPAMTVAELDTLRDASPEATLRAHGWIWSQEQNRSEDGYRFHNTKTFEVCWYPSLEKRLDADRSAPELYERIARGWTPPPLEGGTFTRPPGVAEYASIPLALIDRGRYQPRSTFDQAELEELAASIREHGIIDPIVVFVNERGRYELIAGERRKRAISMVGLTEMPARIIEADLRIIHELSLFENIQRANLSSIEEGKGFNRIITELNISEAELARRLGKNRAYIQQRRAIAGAASEVVAALDSGAITFSQARAIAAAAPGDDKAQKAAVTKLAELTRQGKRTTEAEARQAAEKVVLAKAKAKLEALGWVVDQSYSYTLIWTRCERPRQWTGAEIIEAVNANRAPASVPPTADWSAVTSEQILMLEHRHKVDQNHKPWIGLYQNWNELPTFYAPAELVPIVSGIQAEFDAMVVRYAARGWKLRYQGHSFDAKSSKGARLYLHDWKTVDEQIGQIEAGKVSDEPEKASNAPALQKCADCKQDFRSLTYFEDRRICEGCETTAKQIVVERQTRIASEIALVAGPWLASAPLDALRVLVAALNHAYDPRQRTKVAAGIRQLDAASLNTRVLEWLEKSADAYHFCPVWEPPGSSPLVEPPRAVTIDVPSGDLGDIELTTDDPLDELRTALAAVERWAEDGEYDSTPEEIQINLAELKAIRAQLDSLADAPDVTDGDYEELSATIGELEAALASWLPAESEVSG